HSDRHRRDRVLNGNNLGVLRKDVPRPPALRMIELDLTYFSGRDACDCVKWDIDHRNTLLGLLSSTKSSPSATLRFSPIFSLALCLVSRLRDVALLPQLGERPLFLQPGVIFFLTVDDDFAAHLRVRDAAEFCAKHLECSGAGRREPVVGN